MKSKITLAISILLTMGITACSGGSSTGAIPQQIQAGANSATTTDNNAALAELQTKLEQAQQAAESAQAKLNSLQAELAEQKENSSALQAQLEDAQAAKLAANQTVIELQNKMLDLQKQLASSEQEKQRIAEEEARLKEAQAKLEAEKQQAEADKQKATEETARLLLEKATNYVLGDTSVSKTELAQALAEGTVLQKQAMTENKNINSLIGANAKLPAGTLLTTTANNYGGYAVVRENYSESIGGGNSPFNHFVALAKTATTDKAAVVDATYKGSAAFSTMNYITLMEKTNQGEYQYELTLNVKDNHISGGIVNTNAANMAKRAELGQAAEIISFKNSEIKITDDMVGFSGDAQFNYGYGFLPNAKGDGSGTYQGIFTGEHAEGVTGTFSTNNTAQDSSVQGAFTGTK
ncbi:hypothetical protein V5G99_05580 [Bibersteinia trehalosi]|uniref:hypothetical protein n=1 Tax=Bibersteinia trehalosi TaxID=47735 RepID=UPI00104DB99C|nr:hypothetical protein [Bibersteinia trehalosi]TCT15848.1 hypothetical protein EDC51_105114 [Bibersteinia trehalosi]